jgi:hypothetical protein
MGSLYSLNVSARSSGFTGVALKRALADNFADGVGIGQTIVYTITSDGRSQGFTLIQQWTGPQIPPNGILEKGTTQLLPKHRNQFLDGYLRQEVENDPAYKGARFY